VVFYVIAIIAFGVVMSLFLWKHAEAMTHGATVSPRRHPNHLFFLQSARNLAFNLVESQRRPFADREHNILISISGGMDCRFAQSVMICFFTFAKAGRLIRSGLSHATEILMEADSIDWVELGEVNRSSHPPRTIDHLMYPCKFSPR
jgi:hypothetical protein